MVCRKKRLDEKATAVAPADSIELRIPDEESYSSDIQMIDPTCCMSDIGYGAEGLHDVTVAASSVNDWSVK
jgi:hypothetical protein